MSLIPVFNITSPWAHTESELGVLSVHRKACEICSSLVQEEKSKKNYFSSHKLPKQLLTSFWSQGVKHFIIQDTYQYVEPPCTFKTPFSLCGIRLIKFLTVYVLIL
jgi:hypothetical protein